MCWILIPWQLQRAFSGFYSIWNLVGKNVFLLHAASHKGMPDPSDTAQSTHSKPRMATWLIFRKTLLLRFFFSCPLFRGLKKSRSPRFSFPWPVGDDLLVSTVPSCVHLGPPPPPAGLPGIPTPFHWTLCFHLLLFPHSFTLLCWTASQWKGNTHQTILHQHTNHLNTTNIKMFLSSSSHGDFSPLSSYHIHRHIQKLPDTALSVF